MLSSLSSVLATLFFLALAAGAVLWILSIISKIFEAIDERKRDKYSTYYDDIRQAKEEGDSEKLSLLKNAAKLACQAEQLRLDEALHELYFYHFSYWSKLKKYPASVNKCSKNKKGDYAISINGNKYEVRFNWEVVDIQIHQYHAEGFLVFLSGGKQLLRVREEMYYDEKIGDIWYKAGVKGFIDGHWVNDLLELFNFVKSEEANRNKKYLELRKTEEKNDLRGNFDL